MVILIDAYNVLKGLYKGMLISQEQRDVFIQALCAYGREKQHHVYIVFDGTCDVQWSNRRLDIRKDTWCTIIYAGESHSADHILKKLCHDLQKRDVLLVSSDRQVYSYADSLDIPSIGAHLFYGYVTGEHVDSPEPIRKKLHDSALKKRQGHQSSSELDELMECSSDAFLYRKEEFFGQKNVRVYSTHQGQGRKKKVSKKERRLEKVIKKL